MLTLWTLTALTVSYIFTTRRMISGPNAPPRMIHKRTYIRSLGNTGGGDDNASRPSHAEVERRVVVIVSGQEEAALTTSARKQIPVTGRLPVRSRLLSSIIVSS
jgi:hypothetical protein